MKTSRTALILGFALAAFTSIAQAQLISRTFTVSGAATGVISRFTVWINATNNTLVVDIDNTSTAGSSTKAGTIVGFAFNTPFGTISNVDSSTSGVDFKMKLTVGSNNPSLPNNTWSNDNYWAESSPYNQSGSSYDQDYGVSTSDYSKGIGYGEKATMVFAFKGSANDITTANWAGFFNNVNDNNRSDNDRDFDFTVNWADVAKKADYLKNCNNSVCDIGGWDGTIPSDSELPPTPEPSTYGLMGAAALVGLVAHRRHKAKKAAKAA